MTDKNDIRPGQSIDLLKELHILTRDGKLNQDSRRKLKQIFHLTQFIVPLLDEVKQKQGDVHLVDVGAGKSYLGFLLYDLYFKELKCLANSVTGVETRVELVAKSRQLAERLGFVGMHFLDRTMDMAMEATELPARIDVVTALHACDTATDDAIRFALKRCASFVVLVPCCQAEIAALLRSNKSNQISKPVSELWRHPIHTREFGSHVTNVLRCLQLEAHGYQLSVTELVGWEHSMKNELIVARRTDRPARHRGERLTEILAMLGLEDELRERFFVPNQL